MVKSETRRDAEILVRNPSPRLLGKKFRDSKKVNTNHAKTRLRDLSKTLPRFRDPAKIFRDPRFSKYHSPPLLMGHSMELLANRDIHDYNTRNRDMLRLPFATKNWGKHRKQKDWNNLHKYIRNTPDIVNFKCSIFSTFFI